MSGSLKTANPAVVGVEAQDSVRSELDQLQEEVASLNMVLADLQQRLSSILFHSPDDCPNEEQAKVVNTSPVKEHVKQLRLEVARALGKVEFIFKNLDL